jgi:hypothetical protein
MNRYVNLNAQLQPLPEGSPKSDIAAIYDRRQNITLLFDKLGGKDVLRKEALQIIAKVNKEQRLGFNDWTLGSVEHVFTLADRSRFPCVDPALTDLIDPTWYHTDTPAPSDPASFAFGVDFNDGGVYIYHRSNGRVLAVRVGGPSLPGQ